MAIENEKAWYVIQTYSGLENAAKRNIENRVESMGLQDYIFNILVPEEKSYERKKNGDLKEVITKPFPGYVFIEMIVTDETWFIIRNTPMVTGFLGSSGGGAKPVPLPEEEMIPIFKMSGISENKFRGQIGDEVKIIAGAFAGQTGKIDEIDYDKGTLKVLVDFFGRLTPAELDFSEIKLL